MISYNYDCPGTNQITLNIFTPKKQYETCPGPSAWEFVPGDNFAVPQGVVLIIFNPGEECRTRMDSTNKRRQFGRIGKSVRIW